MRKNIPLILALLGGAAGFGLRKWQLAAGFEPDTHLAIPGAPPAMFLALLSAAAAVVILALIRGNRERLPAAGAFSKAEGNTVYLTAVVLAAFLLLVSGGFEILRFTAGYGEEAAMENQNRVSQIASAVLPPLRILFCIGGLPSALLWGKALFRKEEAKERLSLLALCLLFCLWLIATYQSRAADPVVQDYVYEVLAIVCSLLGLYFIAGYSFLVGKPRRTIFFCLMGAFFSLVTLADAHSYAEMARYGFAVLFLTAHAALLLHQPPLESVITEDETGADAGAETEAE